MDYGKNGFSSYLGRLDVGVYSVSHLFCVNQWRAKRSHSSDELFAKGIPFPLISFFCAWKV